MESLDGAVLAGTFQDAEPGVKGGAWGMVGVGQTEVGGAFGVVGEGEGPELLNAGEGAFEGHPFEGGALAGKMDGIGIRGDIGDAVFGDPEGQVGMIGLMKEPAVGGEGGEEVVGPSVEVDVEGVGVGEAAVVLPLFEPGTGQCGHGWHEEGEVGSMTSDGPCNGFLGGGDAVGGIGGEVEVGFVADFDGVKVWGVEGGFDEGGVVGLAWVGGEPGLASGDIGS